MRHLQIMVVSAGVALLAVPAGAANKDIERLYVQIAALQTQIADLQRTAEESQREVRRLTDLVAEQNAFFRKTTQDRRLQDEAMQTALREMIERMSELDARVQSQAAAAQAAVAAAAVPPAPAPGDDEPGTPAPAPAAPAVAAPPPARELYSQAYADYTRGNYDLAMQGYREYLRYYPDTDLSDNAQYWIGESLYAKRLFGEAVAAWDELLREYPSSDKLPDARFKRAMALERLGRRREALGEYRAVADRYPNSEAGRKAKERLTPQ
jgi:tol-pal system protein YbgF